MLLNARTRVIASLALLTLLAVLSGRRTAFADQKYVLSSNVQFESAQTGTTYPTAIQAFVHNIGDFSSHVPGIEVTFTAPSSGASGTFSATGTSTMKATSDGSGTAQASSFTANNTPGQFTITLSTTDGGINFVFFTNTSSNPVGKASQISAGSGSSQAALINTTYATQLSIAVLDGSNNLLPNIPVSFDAPTSGASGIFADTHTSSTTATTGPTGLATTSTITANNTPGQFFVTATIDGAHTQSGQPLTNSFALTNTLVNANGVPFLLGVASAGGEQAPVLTAFTHIMQVVVLDGSQHYVVGATVTFTAPSTGPSGTFVGGGLTYQTTTGGTGLATATTFTANAIEGSYGVNVSATLNGVTATVAIGLTNGRVETITTLSKTPAGNSVFGQPLVLSATVVPKTGTLVPSAPVTFKLAGTAIGSCTSVSPSSGVAICTLSTLAPATYSFSADYLGDTISQPSTSNTLSHTVVKDSTTTGLATSAPTFVIAGNSVTFTATITANAPGAGTPTGGVTFTSSDGTVLNGGNPVSLSNGSAQVSTSGLLPGSPTITAAYGGDVDFVASSNMLTQNVYTVPVVTTNPVNLTVVEGSMASFSAAATAVPPPTVQWQVSTDGVNFAPITSATTSPYSFTASLADDQKQYRALFTNPAGSKNSTAAKLTVLPLADLAVTKSAPQTTIAGDTANLTYTITVTNHGPSAAQSVALTDTLPSGETFVSQSQTLGPAFALSNTTSSISDTIATLGVGASATFSLVVHVQANVADTTVLTNTATATTSTTLPTPAHNSGNASTTVQARADLHVSKSGPATADVGSPLTYTITVTNNGPSDARNVSVSDLLPATEAFSAQSQPSGPTFTLSNTGNQVTDMIATLAAGASATFSVVARVNLNVPDQAVLSNTATATTSTTDPTPNDNNNTATATTTALALPDLTITKTHTGNFRQGQTGASYTITVSNSGGLATDGTTVTVADTLPTGLTATSIAGTGWSCTLATLTCTRTDVLAAAGSYPAITLTVNVANNAPASVTNTATVAGGGETNTNNDTAPDPTTIIQVADLTVAKTHTGNFRQGDAADTYTITVSNAGPGPTDGSTVTVTDSLPAALTATNVVGAGWSCTLATLTCTRTDVLSNGSSYPAIMLTVGVSATAPASVTNTATVAGGGELNTNNDTGIDPTNITQVADLTLTKTHSGAFAQGDTGDTYTITVSNNGSGPTDGSTVTVTDTLPTALTATAIAGTGWSCTLATLICTRADVLAAGNSYSAITITVNVAINAPASVTNTATVAGGGEVVTTNDSANDVTRILPGPDLTIVKTHTGSFHQGQSGATYTITVGNSGGVPSRGMVTVTDTLPVGLTGTAVSGVGWTCTLATLTCTRTDAVANGSSYPAITLTVSVDGHAPGTLTNTVAVAGGGDVNTTNNTASDPTTITADTTPPTLSCSVGQSVLLPADGSLRAVTVTLAAADPDGGLDHIVLSQVSSTQPITAGDTPGFVAGTTYAPDTTTVSGQIRAAMTLNSHGRSYRLTFVAFDSSGNQASCSVTVQVRPH